MADIASRQRHLRTPPLLWAVIGTLAALLFAAAIAFRQPIPGDAATARMLDQVVLWQSLIPRAAVALLAGGALGLSGALLQRVLRNPIADPSTLGIASGAQLALTISVIYASVLGDLPRELVALVGGLAAVFIVLALGWKRGLEPVTVALSGMTLSLVAAALSSALVLSHGEYVMSLFVWGAGSLHQQSWDGAITLSWRLVLGIAASAILLRPLTVLALDDASAKSLGMAVNGARVLVIGVAVWLAASVTAEVGVIGFIGLAAPAFARLGGVRSPREMLIVAPCLGALLLWFTDGLVQLTAMGGSDLIPTGAAAGLLGGPLLIWLLPRLSVAERPGAQGPVARRLARPGRGFLLLTLLLATAGLMALFIGRSFDGWTLVTGQMFEDIFPFRGPRVAAAIAAGALLGASGTLMQRMTGNPLAGPEVLGVSAGAGVGFAVVLLFTLTPSLALMMTACAIGSLVALVIILTFSAASGFGPERMLLGGVALGATGLAILAAVLAPGDGRAIRLLGWMSGSTDRVTGFEGLIALGAAVILIGPVLLLGRWLDILPLGAPMVRGLGLPVSRTRMIVATVAALMTAVATYFVGPLSLVGLIGPHLARLAGFSRGSYQMIAAACISATLMVLADWLGRMVAFPYQIPVGLFAALVGGPYLVWLLRRGPAKGA
ncbi:Fe3+-hydroxamate ABC transporter permease FhuB [Azorhizobium oxalatiphilum]|uniref:Fe3+-hydroxamate ABC transporter permease FhuB n=1 Tax=Azorhizobium oxalatiphilum TaxID=980631 RepID=A0A917BVJ6_9HYPH|nr:Fe(3+)-hydroxamate ABC transporter permease FhuB [Azorhizobium oxalatiphilum]GGF56282.1 Fe3+-hydroxamate ABC transporter permease FhuB [Azorhizobium oxalatiphilum]